MIKKRREGEWPVSHANYNYQQTMAHPVNFKKKYSPRLSSLLDSCLFFYIQPLQILILNPYLTAGTNTRLVENFRKYSWEETLLGE